MRQFNLFYFLNFVFVNVLCVMCARMCARMYARMCAFIFSLPCTTWLNNLQTNSICNLYIIYLKK